MTTPALTVVVEWENVRLIAAARPRAMLERLREEIGDADRAVEVLLAHDGRPGDVRTAAEILARSGAEVRVVSAPGAGYYELKNLGVREARGELVLFADCDIVPERGWLREIAAPVRRSVGRARRRPDLRRHAGVLEQVRRADARVPGSPDSRPRRPGRAVLREQLRRPARDRARPPFPPVPGTSRASCVVLARRLAEANLSVVQNPSAPASHPVPLGFRRTVRRALVHGRDTAELAAAGVAPPATAGAGVRRVGGLLASVVRDRRPVGLPAPAIPVAVAVALGYYGLVGAGVVLARLAPATARRLDL